MVLYDPMTRSYLTEMTAFNQTVEALEADLRRDMVAEGMDLSQMQLSLELELRYGSSPVTQRIACKELRLRDQESVHELYQEFREHLLSLSLGIDLPEASVRIETFVLRGSVPGGDLPERQTLDSGLAPRRQPPPSSRRDAIWDASLRYMSTPVYAVGGLQEGDAIVGPGIGEARDTTYVIPPGWQLVVHAGGVCEMSLLAGREPTPQPSHSTTA
jgi:N-methylhydantoinase A/acetophenone carboxylase